MKHRILAFVLVCALVFGLSTSAAAQTYRFQLPKEEVHVYWNSDGTVAVDYQFTFLNDVSADPIDFVDVGLPNGSYDFGTIQADVNGKPVRVTSDYQGDGPYGVAVELGNQAIQPGKTGTVHVYIGKIERMYYPDSKDETYASGEFSPTWFGAQYVSGNTDLSVIFHLPQGVQAEEPRYHLPTNWPGTQEPAFGFDADGRVTYTWRSTQANGYTQYTFGASYPAKYLPEDAIVRTTFLDLLLGGLAALFGLIARLLPFCCFGVFFFGLPVLTAVQEHRRKKQYIPPKISIEGHGIKRGLTAVEAAILMGQPLEKVMQMILFGVVKKGAAQVEKRDPLELSVADPLPEGLREYEKDFLEAFRRPQLSVRRELLRDMTVRLVKSVTEKMKGFSGKETIEYYKSINEKAWRQIEAAGTPEVKSQMFEEALEWTMLDKDYDDRARRVFTGPVYVPTWWGRYDPVFRSSTAASAPSAAGGGFNLGSGRGSALPGAELAASIVTSTQNFAQRVLGGNFTESVTKVTNPPPPPSRSGSYRSGGGGCACACACAGCACACAGGGR
ncbi:MAG: hypothetical protein DDG60_08920 [Anaerolineae bacterium]|nr:MAG: hypothetical protein DDG60_08920 [Anaerolineae bacterium]